MTIPIFKTTVTSLLKHHEQLNFYKMKRITLLTFLMSLLSISLSAQNLEVVGKVKITEMDTVTNVSANVVRQDDGTLAVRQYRIGDIAMGGTIFYIDASGEHGLVADTVDRGTAVWFAGEFGFTRANGDGPFAGEMNTAIIISSQVALGDYGILHAARMCAESQRGGYGDWYLPSMEELEMMHINLYLAGIGGFSGTPYYWSSNEADNQNAWRFGFSSVALKSTQIKSVGAKTRAIRAF